MMVVHAGALLYKRKSTVELERRSLGEQDTASRDLAARLGLPVLGDVIEEASAYAERERPKFTAALKRAAEERLVIITWSIDRFSRKGAEAVLPLLKSDAPLRLVTVDGDDTADDKQRLIIIIKAEMALQYSQQLGRNVKRARAAARNAGLWAAGRAPYGYQIAGQGRNRHLEVDAAEADVVRDVAARVLAGERIGTIVGDLNRKGVPGPSGGVWRHRTLKRTLLTPAVAGFLPQGRDMVRDDGQPVVTHEPILPVDVWDRLQFLNWEPQPGGRPPKTLLSGLLRCACGAAMGGNGPKYVCPAPRGTGQAHVSIGRQQADGLVEDLLLGRLVWLGTLDETDPRVLTVAEAWGAVTGDDADRTERLRRQDAVETATSRLQRTVRMVAEGLVDEADAAPLLADYRQQLRTAEARLAELGPSKVDVGQLLEMTRPQWEALGPRQRLVLRAAVDSIEVRPGRGPVAQRLHVNWINPMSA